MKRMKMLAVATAATLSLWAGQVSAQNLDLDEMAAALAFPIVTGNQGGNPIKDTRGDVVLPWQSAATLVSVTNGKSDDVLLKLDMISGDVEDGSTWQSTSFECLLTGRETTTFVFVPPALDQQDGVIDVPVYVECSTPGNPQGAPRALFANLGNGILFMAAADPESGEVISENVIFGDAIVADTQMGQAYSFGAIAFQAGQAQNDGDKVYRFDGDEYAQFPSVLATNFIAPLGDVRAELILFTLDGTVGNLPVPRAKLGGFAYNDDEVAFDFSYEFDCFDIVALDDINQNYFFDPSGVLGLGSISGHLEIVSQPIAAAGPDAHDAEYGDANNSRKRGVHGWIVQNVQGLLTPAGHPIPDAPDVLVQNGPAAWGRPLAQSTTALIPFLQDDDSTLDADTTGGGAPPNGGGDS